MIRKIGVLCVLSLTITAAFAQDGQNGLSFTMKTGITYANMYGPDVKSETFLNGSTPETFYANHPASNQFKTGVNVGVSADYHIGRYFSFGLRAGYIQKGAQINGTQNWDHFSQSYQNVEGDIYWKQDFWTLEIPITLHIPLKRNGFYIQTGFFKGFLIKSEETGDISISGSDYEYTRDRDANDTEPGFFIGGGYMYSFKKTHGNLLAEIIWSRSIIQSPGSDMIPNPQYYYNQTFSVNLGYRYYFSRKREK